MSRTKVEAIRNQFSIPPLPGLPFFIQLFQSFTPSVVTVNTASPSGRLGESTSLAMRFSPLDFLRYSLNVAVWPSTCPPTGLVGSPKKVSGLAMT